MPTDCTLPTPEMSVLEWLRTHIAHDPILRQALDHIQSIEETPESWRVRCCSRQGKEYNVVVVRHPVTGEPIRWHRISAA